MTHKQSLSSYRESTEAKTPFFIKVNLTCISLSI